MKVGVDLGSGKYESRIYNAVIAGIRAVRDKVLPPDNPKCDAIVLWGVKSGHLFRKYRDAGKTVIFFDKGYAWRRTEWFSVAINAVGPGRYMMLHNRSNDRWGLLPWSRLDAATLPGRGEAILLALSSQKYANWYGLGDATQYADSISKQIQRVTDRQIIYRPKPSWGNKLKVDEIKVDSTELSLHRPLDDDLSRAWVLITHGSGAAINAVLRGIPAITLSPDASAAPVSGKDISDLNRSFWAAVNARQQWAYNLAYTQWTLDELESGKAWKHIREDIEAVKRLRI